MVKATWAAGEKLTHTAYNELAAKVNELAAAGNLPDGAVTQAKLRDDNVTRGKLHPSVRESLDKADAAVPSTVVTAKGDLLVGTSGGTVGKVTVGAAGLSPVADAAQTSGIRWGTTGLSPLPGNPTLGSFMRPTIIGPTPPGLLGYEVDGNAPAYSGMNYISYGSYPQFFRVGGVLTNSGGYYFNQINGASGGQSITGYEVECDVYGQHLAFHVFTYGTHDFRVIVDDVAVTPEWQHFSAAGDYFIKFAFSPGVHRVRLLMGQEGFVQALVPAGGRVVAAPPRFRVLATGDSFGHGGTSVDGVITAGTLCGELAMQTGWEVWNCCQGGTGFQNPGGGSGSSEYGSAGRLAAYAALPAMDLIMVIGGANDGILGTYSVSTTRAAAAALFTALKSARPNTPIVHFGVESGVYPAISADLNTLNTGLKAEAALHPDKVAAYIDSRTSPWVTGTGREDAMVGDGNADLTVANDGVHPTHYGWGKVHAHRAVQILKSVRVAA